MARFSSSNRNLLSPPAERASNLVWVALPEWPRNMSQVGSFFPWGNSALKWATSARVVHGSE